MTREFTSWADEVTRYKNAIANRAIEAYFISSTENSREMRKTFSTTGNIQRYLEWLEGKAAEEALGASPGSIYFSVGGE